MLKASEEGGGKSFYFLILRLTNMSHENDMNFTYKKSVYRPKVIFTWQSSLFICCSVSYYENGILGFLAKENIICYCDYSVFYSQ